MIQVKNVTKYFDDFKVLNDFSAKYLIFAD